MIRVVCDFLCDCGFDGVGFNVYGDSMDVVVDGRISMLIRYDDCKDLVTVCYGGRFANFSHHCFDISDPELFAKLKVAVGDILRVEV